MARKVEVTMIDDIDGTSPASTVEFAYEGASYEIDLSEQNKAKLAEALAPFVAVARKTQTARRRVKKVQNVGQVDPALVRQWAPSAGFQVSPRGRVPREVIDAYLAAH
ncbi:Lsr2 family protein [Tessaracoccus sp. OH4464_COT-324]|uniref:histone-like nucleoid-structuring protein Lsr2 n=1 Tax=Tessaracoccus sp. OH4464_COT-324 TaxID=2491059 RepID=UPI000F6379BA|nr:Lsr2 family protein [Tessaracoccus sp. OH4464_COT-324]RRD45837.1 Lsr2 family protein [Tessaracoccus sp. OH4464_COT-324]